MFFFLHCKGEIICFYESSDRKRWWFLKQKWRKKRRLFLFVFKGLGWRFFGIIPLGIQYWFVLANKIDKCFIESYLMRALNRFRCTVKAWANEKRNVFCMMERICKYPQGSWKKMFFTQKWRANECDETRTAQMLVRSLFADMLLLEHNGFNTGAVFNYHQTAF